MAGADILIHASVSCRLDYCNVLLSALSHTRPLYTQDLLHVYPSWERDPSSVAFPEVSSIFSMLKGFLGGIFPYPIRGYKDRGCRVPYRL